MVKSQEKESGEKWSYYGIWSLLIFESQRGILSAPLDSVPPAFDWLSLDVFHDPTDSSFYFQHLHFKCHQHYFYYFPKDPLNNQVILLSFHLRTLHHHHHLHGFHPQNHLFSSVAVDSVAASSQLEQLALISCCCFAIVVKQQEIRLIFAAVIVMLTKMMKYVEKKLEPNREHSHRQKLL